MPPDPATDLDILARTPAVLRGMLAGLPDGLARANYGEGTFSPFDVLGHLVHGERADWIPRMRRILEDGERRAFDPFDRFAMFEESRGKSLAALLDEFESLRAEGLAAARGILANPSALDRRGLHPSLGPVTLGNLLATWVVHDLNHVAQVAKGLAWQWRDGVGPWRTYLPILDAAARGNSGG